jgi:tRNA nucleotidyltransferase (CCA-adding enzyme)
MPAHIPERIIKLARLVRDNGGRALLVGGCVRDWLMNEAPKDWDAEVYGIEPAALRRMLETFGRVDAVGEAFTVYKLGTDLDVSIPRRERKQGRGHRAFIIEGDPAMSFEDALRRRDFTINAVLQDPLTNELIDPFNGQADIANKTLRAVSIETFAEDSLRVRAHSLPRASSSTSNRQPLSYAAPLISRIYRANASGTKWKNCCFARVARQSD